MIKYTIMVPVYNKIECLKKYFLTIINQNFSFNSDDRLKNKNYNTLENSYFVLGDNRPFSKDSRIIGCVQKENIKGVLKVITAHYNDVNDLSKGKKIVPFVYF